MAVIIKPAPARNPIGRGLEKAAGAFATQRKNERERQERDKILRRETLNEFFNTALKAASTPDQVNRIVAGIEKNNDFEPGTIPQGSIDAVASEAELNAELRKIDKATKEAGKSLAVTQATAAQKGLLTSAAQEKRAQTGFETTQTQTRAETSRRAAATTEQIAASKAKRTAGPKAQRPSEREKDILAQSNIDFFERTGRTREEFVAFFGAEDFDPFTAGPEGGPMTTEQIREFNEVNEKFNLGLPAIEVTGRGLFGAAGPERTTVRAPKGPESPEDRLKRLKTQGGVNQ